MSSQKKELGKIGERLAADYLQRKGYKILHRNWRSGRLEIDLIAEIENIKIIVEVKTLSSDEMMEPAANITQIQMKRLADAYAYFADAIDYSGECRFDVIGVLLVDLANPKISHYEDAFFPG